MSLPLLGSIDPLAIVALAFLAAILVVSSILFMWIRAQGRKGPGQK